MADSLNVKPKVDTSDFSTGMVELRRQLKDVETGFKSSAAALGDWAKDATGLEMRIKALNSEIEIQGKKVALTRAEYEHLVGAQGENSIAAQNMHIKLNQETETLNKMEYELGATSKELVNVKKGSDQAGQGVQGMAQEEEQAVTVTELLNGVMGGLKLALGAVLAVLAVVAAGIIAMGAAGIGAVKGISELVNTSAEAADQIATLSGQTGIATDKLQEMAYIGTQLDVSMDAVVSANTRLIRSMESAKKGTGAQAEAFKELGVAWIGPTGQLRDSQAVFNDLINALGRVQDPTERDALTMTLLGKSAMELNPLIKAGADGLARLSEEAHKNGAVAMPDVIEGLDKFSDAMAGLKQSLQATGATIAGFFLPYFSMIGSAVQEQLGKLSSAMSGARGLDGATKAFSAWFINAANDFAKTAPTVVKNIADTLNRNMPILIPALTQGLTTIAIALAQMAPIFVNMAIVILTALGNALVANAPALQEPVTQMLIAIGNLLVQSIPTLGPALAMAAISIVGMLVVALINAIYQLEAEGVNAAIAFVRGISSGILGATASVGAAGMGLLSALYNGFVNSIGRLAALGPLVTGFLSGVIRRSIQALVDAGGSLVDGIWQGISNAWASMMANIEALVQQLPQEVRDALGIASPSKVGISIGKNFGGSIGAGMFPAINEVQNGLSAAMRGFSNPALAGGAQNGVGQSVRNENFGFDNFGTVIFQGAQTPGTLAAQIKGKRY